MAEPDGLVDVVGPGVDRERRRLGRRQDLDLAVAHLDLAGRQVRVDRALGPGADRAGDAHARTRCGRRPAWSTTHCTRPVWSRRSRKARCSPCSRRRATQPHRLTVRPASLGPEGPALVGAHARGSAGAHDGDHARTASTSPCGAPPPVADRPAPRRPAAARSVTTPAASSSGADDHRDRRARAVGRLHLALHAPLVERPVGGDAGRPQLGGEGQRLLRRRSCRRRRRRPRAVGAANTPSASQASRIRSIADAEADAAGPGGPPRSSTRPS